MRATAVARQAEMTALWMALRREGEMVMDERPNVLFIMSDEHTPQVASPYGHPFVHTPALQRLADEGAVFDRFYCNAPLCVPSRMSFMTGRYASQVACYDLGCSLSSDHATWAHLLDAAGYETVLCGKMHFNGPDQRHGFRRRPVEDIHGLGTLDIFPDWTGKSPLRLLGSGGNFGSLVTGGGKMDDGSAPSIAYDRQVHAETVRYLEEYARSTRERPFCLVAGYYAPHWPFICEQRYWDRYWPEHADLPRHSTPPHHPAYRRLQQLLGYDERFDEQQIRRCRAAYYGLVTCLDEHIGGLLDTLDGLGLAENTVVVYTSDHGEMLGERGLWCKEVFLEGSARVPFLVRWPGQVPAGTRIGAVASLVDATATLLALAGIERPPYLVGNSLLGLLKGDDPQWKDTAFSEHLAHGATRPQCSYRKGRYKLNVFAGEASELYDLDADPDELDDLAASPQHAAVLASMSAAVESWWDAPAMEAAVLESQALRRLTRAGERALAR